MQEIGKLAFVALASAVVGAVAVEAVQAKVTSSVQVSSPAAATVIGNLRRTSYADWEGALNTSFGSRVLATGANTEGRTFPRSHTNTSVFAGMDKMQIWRDGSRR